MTTYKKIKLNAYELLVNADILDKFFQIFCEVFFTRGHIKVNPVRI